LDESSRGKALVTIERNAQVQAKLIEDLLDVSRIISGKLNLNVQPLNLAQIVETALDTIRPAAEAKDIRLASRLDLALGARFVVGDANRLQQVVWNLLSNAVKFTPRHGGVAVALERHESTVQLTISDTGQGIRPEFLPHIFDRFRQADSSTTRYHTGLGLGLAIVRHLVEMHGGTVQAESPGE